MSKITVQKKENFTVLDNTLFKDDTLSWKAKGLLAYLLHLPNDWQIYLEDLKNRSTDGIDSTRSALNELIEKGYILRKEVRDKGKFKGYDYTVLEKPISVKPNTEKPISDNPILINTKDTKKLNKLNTNIISEIDKLEISEFLKDKFKEWYEYKKQIKNTPKTMQSFNKMLNQIGKDFKDEKHLSDSIDQSIMNEYKGVFPKKESNYTNKEQPKNKIVSLETMKGWNL